MEEKLLVVVYLGAATAASDLTMHYLMQVEKQVGMPQTPPRDGDIRLEGLRDILSRPWFQRALVVQDILLKMKIIPDYSVSQKDLIRAVIANLCFCELTCVPEHLYNTIDEFLPSLRQIDNHVLENIF